MGRVEQSRIEFASDERKGAEVIGAVVLGGAFSLIIWAGIISFFVL